MELAVVCVEHIILLLSVGLFALLPAAAVGVVDPDARLDIVAVDMEADAVSLINTLMGMVIDTERRKPLLSIGTGGLSGPAVKPVAVRCVWQVAKAVRIPVIGLGGIMNAKDAIEFLMAGACAIEIGTANFIDPAVSVKVAQGINDWLDQHGCKSIKEIIGAAL